jgi:hypothetical protein
MSRHSYFLLAALLFVIFCVAAPLQAAKTQLGGHVKMVLYDDVFGQRTGTAVPNPVPEHHEYTGFILREMILYVSSELNDRVSVDLQPVFEASSGATPKFGKDIGAQKTAASAINPEFGGWVKAIVKMALPRGYEVSAGIVKPRFTWDYGAELFWEDAINGNKFTANTSLGAMHDAGIEVYKNFEVGNYSIPTYAYALNGGYEFSDNNRGVGGMIHVEPEFGPVRFLGSFYTGRYDVAYSKTATRWAAGFATEWRNLAFRTEYAGGLWEDYPQSKDIIIDRKPKGFYANASYRFVPWARATLDYSVADQNWSTGSAVGEKFITLTPSLQVYASESAIIIVQYDIADWSRLSGSEKLEFNRATLGMRVTF